MHWDHEPWKAPNVGQASRLPSERASASDSVPSALPTEAGETPALPCGSWRVLNKLNIWTVEAGRVSLNLTRSRPYKSESAKASCLLVDSGVHPTFPTIDSRSSDSWQWSVANHASSPRPMRPEPWTLYVRKHRDDVRTGTERRAVLRWQRPPVAPRAS